MCKTNSSNLNLYYYCSNFADLQIFSLIGTVGDFGAWMCKIEH